MAPRVSERRRNRAGARPRPARGGVAAYLGALGREQFTVLAIEDVHWAAAPVLDLLDALADALTGTRVLLVCTARPQLLDARPSWGAGQAERDDAHARRTCRSTSRRKAPLLPPRRRARTRRRCASASSGTAGSPFSSKRCPHADRRARPRAAGRRLGRDRAARLVATPDSIHSVLAARLDLLDPEGRDALRRCSVVGQTFWPRAVGVEEDRIAALARSGPYARGRARWSPGCASSSSTTS